MKLKIHYSLVIATLIILYFTSCTSSPDKKNEEPAIDPGAAMTPDESIDPKGVGKFTHVELTHPLDKKMVADGKGVYDLKCLSCHKLTDEKLVGPGWKKVTDRRQPEWIMNFVTNTEEMLAKDTAAQKLYEICLVKMPNQNMSDNDARSILEFMRNNDGKE